MRSLVGKPQKLTFILYDNYVALRFFYFTHIFTDSNEIIIFTFKPTFLGDILEILGQKSYG